MSEENPFRKLKLAVERQQLPAIDPSAESVIVEPSHPVTAFLAESIRKRAKAATIDSLEVNEAAPEEAMRQVEVIPANDDAEVMIEPRPGVTTAHSSSVRRETLQSRAVPTSIVIHVPRVETAMPPHESFSKYNVLEDAVADKRFANISFDRMRAHLGRPRALGIGVGAIVVCLLSVNVFSSIKSGSVDEVKTSANEHQLRSTLALLDQPIPATPQTATANTPTNMSTDANAAALVAPSATINEYVRNALPQLTGPQPRPSTALSVPAAVQQRPLPAVPVVAAAAVLSAQANASITNKPAVSDDIDGGVPSDATKQSDVRRKSSKASKHRNEPQLPSAQHGSGDPLASVFIKAEVISSQPPFSVRGVRRKEGQWQANIAGDSKEKSEGSAWYPSGQIFSNGWQIVDVTAAHVAFLSPDGQTVTSIEPNGRNP